ncbi:Sodium/glutamate symport protein [Klebsiella pneumoniae]|uniref:Sodium/glutamate symport protein n=1 Tax=Klebsiella pneumoniae TaxID=573 RepID=A0A2X3GEC0_KLEPN|nr:Sodium/glutamate symport protein [Klebsiella pneumoniae]
MAPTAFEKPDVGRVITSLVLIESIALIAICLTLGKVVAQLLAGSVFELPTFVCVLFIGVILSNSLALAGLYRVFDRAVSVLGNVSLSLFLAMALMSLKLWELASLALPMIIILAVQALAMALYAVFVTYRMMGKKLRCRGAGSRALRVWPGGNADGDRQYAGDYRPFRAIAYGLPGSADGGGVLYRYRQRAGD